MNKKFKVYRVVNFLAIKSSEKRVKQRNLSDIECRLKDRYIKKKQDRVLETSTCISANSFSAIATPVDRMVCVSARIQWTSITLKKVKVSRSELASRFGC